MGVLDAVALPKPPQDTLGAALRAHRIPQRAGRYILKNPMYAAERVAYELGLTVESVRVYRSWLRSAGLLT